MIQSNDQVSDAKPDTKDRILDAAEKLFAEQGFAATSLRQITSLAGVNLAAVNYHFQSKDALIVAVMARKIGPINRRRLELLDACEAKGSPRVEEILRCFFMPLFEAGEAGVDLASFPRLLARIYTESGDHVVEIFKATFQEVAARFREAFHRAMPGMDWQTVALAIHFSIGAVAHFLGAHRMLSVLAGGEGEQMPFRQIADHMIRFCAAGMRAMEKPEGQS